MKSQGIEQVLTLLFESRDMVDTATAAHYLCRHPQTLRTWASLETGPLRPRRVHGRLAWSMSEIRTLLGVNQPNGTD